MRVIAAVTLFLKEVSKRFVFCTGITQKNISQFGKDVPTEALVYFRIFLQLIREEMLEPEEIILEEKSTTTLENIREVLDIIKDRKWKKVAIVSSAYHIRRVKALCSMALKQVGLNVSVDFLSAEGVLMPGKYDEIIKNAYKTEEARKRIKNERAGVQDIKEGRYAIREFQL